MEKGLDYSDVSIRPRFSSVENVTLKRKFEFLHSPLTIENIPIVTTIFHLVHFIPVVSLGFFVLIDEYISIEELVKNKEDINKYPDNYALKIDTSECYLNKLVILNEILNFKCICIETNPEKVYSKKFCDFCLQVRRMFPEKIIIAGNIICKDMAHKLFTEGKVDVVKVGLGCLKAEKILNQTGVGFPGLTAILECSVESRKKGGHIMGDGIINCPGDLCKSFGAGAGFVEVDNQVLYNTYPSFIQGLTSLCFYNNSSTLEKLTGNVTFMKI